jgi:hypothetical protein
MALVVASLKSSLEGQWLPSGNNHAASATESGDKFATAFATWFSTATAGPFPCSTALARKSQLASLAASAFQAQTAVAAGNALALGIALYIVGQSFGSGVANMPLAQSAVGALFGAAFADLQSDLSARAQQFATGGLLLAVSTLVVIPTPPSTLPVS